MRVSIAVLFSLIFLTALTACERSGSPAQRAARGESEPEDPARVRQPADQLGAGRSPSSIAEPGVRGWRLRLIEDGGFGDPDNIGVGRISAQGDWLYLGTWNGVDGAMMYRSRDGEQWELMGTGPFTGNANDFVVVSIALFGDRLYVGTWNQENGAAMFRADPAVEDAADVVWEEVTNDGFGNPNNTGFTHMRAFKGYLYAGCFNYEEGSEVWRSATGDPGSWTMVIPKGWNTEGNTDSTVMLVHGDHLYIGTESARSKLERGAQLWRTDGQLEPPWNQWQQVNTDGFGNPANHNICGLGELDGRIYAGTWNETQGLEVWRATPTDEVPFADWEPVSRNGFGFPEFTLTSAMVAQGGALYLSGFKWDAGLADLYEPPEFEPGERAPSVFARTTDGLTWHIITRKGFMERPMAGIMWIEAFGGRIFIGGQGQGAPLELWVYERLE